MKTFRTLALACLFVGIGWIVVYAVVQEINYRLFIPSDLRFLTTETAIHDIIEWLDHLPKSALPPDPLRIDGTWTSKRANMSVPEWITKYHPQVVEMRGRVCLIEFFLGVPMGEWEFAYSSDEKELREIGKMIQNSPKLKTDVLLQKRGLMVFRQH